MRYAALILLGCITSFNFGQGVAEAKQHFDRFEYAEVIRVLENRESNQKLELDDLKTWGYSYYAIGNFPKALQFIDSVLHFKPIEPLFYYFQGECRLALGQTEKAIESFEIYRNHDSQLDVSLRIESAKVINTWESLTVERMEELPLNHNKASAMGSYGGHNQIVLREVGIDKSGNIILNPALINQAELLLMRPFILDSTNELQPIEVIGIGDHWSIHDFIADPLSNDVYVTISQPFASQLNERMHQIYLGSYDDQSHQLTITNTWKHLESSNYSSAGFVAINESGKLIVFSASTTEKPDASLYVCKREQANNWSKPTLIPFIDSPQDEVYPKFSGDTLLYFSSNGHIGFGGLDIYALSVADENFIESSLIHLPYPINSFKDDFGLFNQGDSIIYVTSNRLASTSDDNILALILPIKIIEEIEPEEVEENPEQDLIAQWSINYLYFEFDNYQIKADDNLNYDELKSFLIRNPEFKLQLTGKTDERGSEDYNYQLGLKRAQSMKTILVNFGISADQIVTTSKGKSEPLIDCSSGCSEKDHAKNRTVVIELIY
jgi:tetratricopeptide (TPR) repeat protein/flagellar motor protein MotB